MKAAASTIWRNGVTASKWRRQWRRGWRNINGVSEEINNGAVDNINK
jgi:hypothetical protein